MHFALSFIPQLLYSSYHGRKTKIHSTVRISNGVVVVKDALSRFAFKLCAEIFSFHWGHLPEPNTECFHLCPQL